MTGRPGRRTCTATTLVAFALFETVSPKRRTELAAAMSMVSFGRNEFVIRVNDTDRDVLFVVSGAVRACIYSEDGKQVQFEDLGPRTMFGELAAIDGRPRSADCFATTDTVLARLPRARFRALVREEPDVAEAVMIRLSAMVRRQLERVLEFSTSTVAQRIRLELVRLAASGTTHEDDGIVFDRVPTHADIAARISTHREAVSRELKALESSGLITWRPGAHAIHDLAALTASARPVGAD